MVSRLWRFGGLAAALIVFFSFPALVHGFSIKGQLVHSDSKAISEVPIVVLRVQLVDPATNPDGEKVLGFLNSTTTDAQGKFQFNDIQPENGIGYRLGISFQGRRLSSETITADGKDITFSFDIAKRLAEMPKSEEAASTGQLKEFFLAGKVQFKSKSYFSPSEVALIAYSLSENQQIISQEVGRTDLAKNGSFSFGKVTSSELAMFKLGVVFQGRWLQSELFGAKQGQRLNQTFRLPELSKDASSLTFSRTSVLFALQDNQLKVTELLQVSNPTANLIEVDSSSFQKQYPAGLQNIKIAPISEHSLHLAGSQLTVAGFFPPGDSLELVEYNLDKPFYSISLTYPLFAGTEFLDVIVPTGMAKLSLEPEGAARKIDVQNNESYYVVSLDKEALKGLKQVTIKLSGFLSDNQLYLWIGGAIAILLLFTLAGFFWLFRRRLRQQKA